jgi:type II secretion system protein H
MRKMHIISYLIFTTPKLADSLGGATLPIRYRNKCAEGVTLFELIIVLTIIGIMAAVATQVFNNSHQQAKLQQAADRLTADLRLVANQARQDQQTYELVVNTVACSYQATGVKSLTGKDDITVDLGEPPYEISSITMNFGGDTKVSFDNKGYVATSGNIVLTMRNKQMVIDVNEVGKVEQQ